VNTLTKNRILQEGDEYKDNGAWKPVPKDNLGLQVMFTPSKEVRRPSEKPSLRETPETARPTEAPKRAVSPTLISPKQAAGKIATPVAAESEKVPVPTHSGTGHTLPTIVSKKAHTQESDRKIIDDIPYDQPMTDEEMAALEREKDREKAAAIKTAPPLKNVPAANVPAGPIEKAIAKAKVTGASKALLEVSFAPAVPPDPSPIWTGRNGTFTGYGLHAMTIQDMVTLSPIGKRGVGHCEIQFPKAIIPQLVDWLLRQQK
jgi:hypothetical protein